MTNFEELNESVKELSRHLASHLSSNCGQIYDEFIVALSKETFKNGEPKEHLPKLYKDLLSICHKVSSDWKKYKDEVNIMQIESEEEAMNLVNRFIEENNLNAEIDFYDGDGIIEVLVDRTDFERALSLYQRVLSLNNNFLKNLSVIWKQKTPHLVHAEVGDFVMIFNEYDLDDQEASVALVASKYENDEKQIAYGCRYIKPSNIFELTEENYGGYHLGFLKILTSSEVEKHIKSQLIKSANEQIEKIKNETNNAISSLPDRITRARYNGITRG